MYSQTIDDVAAEITNKFKATKLKKSPIQKSATADDIHCMQSSSPTNVSTKCGNGLGLSINSIFQSLVFQDVAFKMTDLLHYGMMTAGILLVLIFLCPMQIFLILLVLIFIVLFLVNLTATLMRKRLESNSNKRINPKKLNNLRKKYNIPQA